jgi:hypothetical protein
MNKASVILAIFLSILSGCRENRQSTEDFITVDVTTNYPQKELILQDFLDVEYITLETNDEFLTSGYAPVIGESILLVRNTNLDGAGNIFIFDRKTGKGLRKINRRGQGNGEYTSITGKIVLDEDNGEMYVNSGDIGKVFVYDLFGNFKRSFKYMDSGDESYEISYHPIYSFDQNNIIVQDYYSGKFFSGLLGGEGFSPNLAPRNKFFIISKQDGNVTTKIQIPYEKNIFQILVDASGGVGSVENPGLIPYQDSWILVEPSADTIYSYSADHTLTPFIVRTPSVQSMDPKIFLFPGVITDRYYFLQTVKMVYDETEDYNLQKTDLVYDKQENAIFKYTVYNDDFTTKRPIKNLVNAIPDITVVNNNEVAFIEKIDAYELVEAYKNGQLKGYLKEIAAGLNEESNSVIMLAKYKK